MLKVSFALKDYRFNASVDTVNSQNELLQAIIAKLKRYGQRYKLIKDMQYILFESHCLYQKIVVSTLLQIHVTSSGEFPNVQLLQIRGSKYKAIRDIQYTDFVKGVIRVKRLSFRRLCRYC